MKDPLAGKRKAIMRREVTVLIWPAVSEKGELLPAPVSKGDRFQVSGVPVIEIERVTRKLPAGRKAEWHATFVRHEVDRPQLLRRVPSGIPDGPDKTAGMSELERARVESAYTSSPRQAIVDEPESVGPDWEDSGVAVREEQRRRAVSEVNVEEANRRAARRIRAKLDEVPRLGRSGKDLTPQLEEIYDRLNDAMEDAA